MILRFHKERCPWKNTSHRTDNSISEPNNTCSLHTSWHPPPFPSCHTDLPFSLDCGGGLCLVTRRHIMMKTTTPMMISRDRISPMNQIKLAPRLYAAAEIITLHGFKHNICSHHNSLLCQLFFHCFL